MTQNTMKELEAISLRVREHILKMSTDGGCFTGASLSCTDLLVYLYHEFLNIAPNNLRDPLRDYVLLSKGHDVPALYGLLAELGFMSKERLKNHLKISDDLYWHPNVNIPGVEFHSGSLGHLLSVGMGIALDIKMRGGTNLVVVILGDGELNEGSIWEALLVAASLKLNNLVAVIDRNWFQANIRTEDLNPLEPLEDKFRSFHWKVSRCNGHDFQALDSTFRALDLQSTQPNVVIADTQRGRGVPSLTERADRWFCNFNRDEVEELIYELHGQRTATLTSETLIVR